MPNYFDKYDAPAPQQPVQQQGGFNDPATLYRLAGALQKAGKSGEAVQIFKQAQKAAGGGGDDVTYGFTPQLGYDENGNIVAMQYGSNGSLKRVQAPEGITLARDPKMVDTGTGTAVFDPVTREVVGNIDKNVRGAANEQAAGTVEGQTAATRAAAAPGQVQQADIALSNLDRIQKHPGMEWGTGFSSYLNFIPGTPGFDFNNLVEQAKGGAFLSAIDNLRGMGALSNVEGTAATAAINRMNVATSKEAFLEALSDYRAIVEQGRAKAQAIIDAGGGQAPQGAPQGQPAQGAPQQPAQQAQAPAQQQAPAQPAGMLDMAPSAPAPATGPDDSLPTLTIQQATAAKAEGKLPPRFRVEGSTTIYNR